MSHFTVLVIGKDLDSLYELNSILGPYHEFESTGCDDEYVQDIDVTQDCIDSYADFKAQHRNDEFMYPTLKDYIKNYCNISIFEQGEQIYKDGSAKFAYAIFDKDKLIRVIRRTNPNSKWDWYSIGGRWWGYLRCVNGAYDKKMAVHGQMAIINNHEQKDIDITRVADIVRFDHLDLSTMKKIAENERRHKWELVKAKCLEAKIDDEVNLDELRYKVLTDLRLLSQKLEIDKDDKYASYDEFIEREGAFPTDYYTIFSEVSDSVSFSKIEDWIKTARPISTFAILDENGWHERGEMGWWGIVSNEKDEKEWNEFVDRRISQTKPDDWFAIVDCHI